MYKYCQACNMKLMNSMNFCPSCGNSLFVNHVNQTSNLSIHNDTLNEINNENNIIFNKLEKKSYSFFDAIKICLNKYATFRGRASRTEYWYFHLFYWLVLISSIILFNQISKENYKMLILIPHFLLWLPLLAVHVRRMHDINKTGWIILISVIPLIGPIIILVLNCQRGTIGPNKYGPDPYY